MIRRGLSVILSIALVLSSGSGTECAAAIADLTAAPSSLPQFQLAPPGRLGKIVDYFNAPSPQPSPDGRGSSEATGEGTAPLVVLIQDLHAHYGVQRNIAGLLEFLDGKLRNEQRAMSNESPLPIAHRPLRPLPSVPFAVGMEGAEGPIDLTLASLFPDRAMKMQAADFFMREGEITGPEYFAIDHGLPDLLTGVENETYYQLHRELFRKTFSDRQKLVEALNGIKAEIAPLPAQTYGPSLKAIQDVLDNYDQGKTSALEMISAFLTPAEGLGINFKTRFPILSAFSAQAGLKNRKTGFSQERVRGWVTEFLTNVANRLSATEKKNLSVLAKMPNSAPYFLYMRDLVYEHQLFLAAPPELAGYLEYMHTVQTAGFDRVLYEARELGFLLEKTTATTSKEKDLVQVTHDLAMLSRLADLQATEYEVRDFAPRMEQFIALSRGLLSGTGLKQFNDDAVRQMISSSIDFYAIALMRNKPMMENTSGADGKGRWRNEQRATGNESGLADGVTPLT